MDATVVHIRTGNLCVRLTGDYYLDPSLDPSMIHLLMCGERKFDRDLTSWKLAYMCLVSHECLTLSCKEI